MVNQLLGMSNESEIEEMAQLFSDFVDGCISLPINLPGFAYHTAMKVCLLALCIFLRDYYRSLIYGLWKFLQARKTIVSKISSTIERQRTDGGLEEVGNGLLGRLLREEILPDEAIADFIINLIFAGNETTAKTMLFAVYFLQQSPNALKILQV